MYLFQNQVEFIRKYLWLILLSFPGILLIVFELWANPVLGVWVFFQSNVPSGFSFEYLIGYSLVFLLVLAGLITTSIKTTPIKTFALLWLIINCLVLILPGERFDRKLIQGLQVPIIVFIVWGVEWLLEHNPFTIKGYRTFVFSIMILLFVLPNIPLLHRDGEIYQLRREQPFSITPEFSSGLDWLAGNSNSGDVVLSSYYASNLIPGLVGRPVYHGHYDQTIDANMKTQIVEQELVSYVHHTDPLKVFIRQEHINYIFEDEGVRALGGLDTNQRPYLKLVYENPDVKIYQIDQANLD